MQQMLDHYDPTGNCGNLVAEMTTDGFPIRLYQSTRKKTQSFAVQYGKQLDHHLTYAEACEKLGQAILHDLSCQGKVDNERD